MIEQIDAQIQSLTTLLCENNFSTEYSLKILEAIKALKAVRQGM
jgi:hypothetical protein